MKQFQVVQQIVDQNNGLITANFGLPIKIEPYSQITLDKFQATIEQTLTKINLSNQIVSISLNRNNYYTITYPSANYNTVTDFLQVFLQRINNSFTSSVEGNSFNFGLGLSILGSIVSNSLTMNYVSVDVLSITPDNKNGCTPDPTGEIYIYDGDPSKIWFHTSDNVTVLRGGGFFVGANFRPDIVGGKYTTQFQLIDESVPDDLKYIAFGQDKSLDPLDPGAIFIFSSSAPGNRIYLDSFMFYDEDPITVVISFTQVDGYYHIDIKDLTETILIYSYGGINETALGSWTINDSNVARFSGTCEDTIPYVNEIENPGFSVNYQVTEDSITGSGLNYSVIMDLTQADQIRLGLGLTPNLVVFSPLNSNASSFLSLNPINFSSIRSALSLSLEILEIPLDSYIFGSSTFYGKGAKPPPNALVAQRQPGQRVNVLSYFVPQITDIASNLFRYQSSEYQWLNMVNKQTLEFSSLNFRVYVTETGEPIQANNLSFNFLTRDREEAGFSQSNSNEVVSKFQYK